MVGDGAKIKYFLSSASKRRDIRKNFPDCARSPTHREIYNRRVITVTY